MSNSNTPNEPERTEVTSRPPETVADYCARVCAEAAARTEEDWLRTFLKDCGCPCCNARARLRTLRETSYDRAEHSSADIHCASSDRRNDNSDALLAARYALANSDEERQAVRAAAERSREDSGAGPACAD